MYSAHAGDNLTFGLKASWNRPGKFFSGRLHRWSTVNLTAGALGIFLILVSICLAVVPVTAPDDYGRPLKCGSMLFAADKQVNGRSPHAEILGYQSLGEGEHSPSNELSCIYARAQKRGPSFVTGLIGTGLLVGATAFVQIRNSRNSHKRQVRGPGSSVLDGASDGGLENFKAPPGWYPDQQDPSMERWFNGSNWTRGTREAGTGNPYRR